ncbi:plasmid recombination protein, partial [Bacillus paranthracis]
MSMSVSLKKATNKTNIRHNNRTMSEKEKEQNSHIDYSRSDENKYLVQKDLKKLYREEFGEVLENYNAKQKRNDRKIDDYYKHIQSSKKTSLQQEMIIQVGDKDDFSSKQDFEKANEILEEWLLGFEKRNPNLKIYNAVIHNDEASPHMHLNFVPVASGYKRGLEKQVSFDRAITQQDPKLDKTRPFDDWREKEVKILEEMLKERGIERKLVGSNNYKDVNEYKEKKDLEKEILSLENQLFEKKNELLEMSERLPGEIKIKAEREKKTEVVNKGFLKKEKVEKPTGNWIVETKELKRVQGIINAGYSVKKDYDRLQR